jgi:hypothetical protein
MIIDKELSDVICSALPKLDGWCSLDKAHKLAETIVEHKAELVVEIGVYGGSSFIPMCLALKYLGNGLAVGIDPWSVDAALECMEEEVSRQWWSKRAGLNEMHRRVNNWISYHNVAKHAQLIKDKAENVVGNFEDNSIDLLHVDGNHSEEMAYKDVTLYDCKVKGLGFVFVDDVGWYEKGKKTLTKSLQYLSTRGYKELDPVGDCAIFQKLTV